jgi:hypothetical protein
MGSERAYQLITRLREYTATQSWQLIVSPRATARLSAFIAAGIPDRQALIMAALGAYTEDQRAGVFSHLGL